MKDTTRSPVPDLLFEDVIAARVRDLAPWLSRPRALPSTAPLHRLTLFLTYGCNLRCPFCKTIARSPEELAARPQKRRTYDARLFDRVLSALGTHPMRHLHLTGGEAALLIELPIWLRNARAAGVERLSITSNGALPIARYEALLAAGLDELRISVAAFDEALGDRRAGKPGAWRASMATLQAIAGMRGRRAFVIANAVVGHDNQRLLPEIVRHLLEAGADDVKLIPEVDERGRLGDFEGAQDVLQRVEEQLAPGRHPLLRRKLRTVFSPQSVGLEDRERPPSWRCFVPLTERTADAVHYYPCSVYLREDGAPLGRLDEPPEVQREKTVAFVEGADCTRDPICRRYCLACTRAFNDAANDVAPALDEARERIRRAREKLALAPRPPFLVVTPAGMPSRERLAEELAAMGVTVLAKRPIADWARASTLLYTRDLGDARVGVALAFEEMWRARFPDQRAERWELDQITRVSEEKDRLRRAIGGRALVRPPAPLPRFPDLVKLEPLHVPDPDRAEREAAWLDGLSARDQIGPASPCPTGAANEGRRGEPARSDCPSGFSAP